jgi:hypothetical protein
LDGRERRERHVLLLLNDDDDNLCDRLAFIKERNFSDFNNGINSYNSGNVYEVFGYGYVT